MHSQDRGGKLPVAARGLVGFPPNKDGSIRIIWRAPKNSVRRGYLPKTVKIDLDIRDPANHDVIRLICDTEQAKVRDWESQMAPPARYDGTIKSLCEVYQTHEASPYRAAKFTTQHDYDYELRLLKAAWGSQHVTMIKAEDILRLHRAAAASGEHGEALRKAQGVIKRLRAIISFGVMIEIPECIRLDVILSKMRFPTPPRRTKILTYDMAKAIIAEALNRGRISIALAQAIQFETGLRQIDVIGEYQPVPKNESRRYRPEWHGLTWEMIDENLVLSMQTSKTGASVTHALGAMSLVSGVLEHVPEEKRHGPVIVSETNSNPYRSHIFSRTWRTIATAAGVPANVWNRDSRAGALSEGDEAGAEITKLQRMAGHTTAKMTGRYVRGKAVEQSEEIARLRTRKRQHESEA